MGTAPVQLARTGSADQRLLHAAHAVVLSNPVGRWLVGQLNAAVLALLRGFASSTTHWASGPLAGYLLRTPDLLAEPVLRRAWLVSLSCLFALSAALVVLAGLALATGRTGRAGLAARELVGTRLIAGLLTAAGSLPLVSLEVRLANACVQALLPQGFPRLAVGESNASGLAMLVLLVVTTWFLVLLLVLSIARWATLWLLVVLAPFAMGFALLPGGAELSRVWWRLQLTAVFLPLGYAALLLTYRAMLGSHRTGIYGALAGVAILGLMAKLPRWAAGAAIGMQADDMLQRLRLPLPHLPHRVGGAA
jgi:hypothetical protein